MAAIHHCPPSENTDCKYRVLSTKGIRSVERPQDNRPHCGRNGDLLSSWSEPFAHGISPAPRASSQNLAIRLSFKADRQFILGNHERKGSLGKPRFTHQTHDLTLLPRQLRQNPAFGFQATA